MVGGDRGGIWAEARPEFFPLEVFTVIVWVEDSPDFVRELVARVDGREVGNYSCVTDKWGFGWVGSPTPAFAFGRGGWLLVFEVTGDYSSYVRVGVPILFALGEGCMLERGSDGLLGWFGPLLVGLLFDGLNEGEEVVSVGRKCLGRGDEV